MISQNGTAGSAHQRTRNIIKRKKKDKDTRYGKIVRKNLLG